jgi:ketosteroid isomerase-like protein
MTLSFFFLAFAGCIIFANAQNDRNVSLSPDEADVFETIIRWNDAFEANDSESYFEFIHDDITVITPSNPYRVTGKPDDRKEFEYAISKGTKVGYFQELEIKIKVIGNVAIATYYSRGSYISGAEEKTLYLKETDVLIKQEGKWKIIHIHVSS